MAGFNWGNSEFGKDGKFGAIPDDPAREGRSKGALEFVGGTLDKAVQDNADAMAELMDKMNKDNGGADPANLAKYQQVFEQWKLAGQLRANTVAKVAELATEIMRKT